MCHKKGVTPGIKTLGIIVAVLCTICEIFFLGLWLMYGSKKGEYFDEKMIPIIVVILVAGSVSYLFMMYVYKISQNEVNVGQDGITAKYYDGTFFKGTIEAIDIRKDEVRSVQVENKSFINIITHNRTHKFAIKDADEVKKAIDSWKIS